MRDKKLAALDAAIAEAERFLSAAKKARAGWHEYRYDGDGETYLGFDSVSYAAAKRASMDLTRALAAFRRGEPR